MMKKNNLTILDIHNAILNKKTSFLKIAKLYAKNTKKLLKNKTNAIVSDLSADAINNAKNLDKLLKKNELDLNNLLLGSVCSLKDNICLENYKTTGGSIFLKSFIPSYTATVAKLLINDNVLINSKSNMDELGLGGTGTFSGFGVIKNTIYPNRITGGSSSGTVLAVKANAATFGIATDTGDSIRRPCSFMGLYGLKPSYGLVSRYGVLPYSPSLDHVGIVANSIQDIAIVLSSIAKNDIKDHTNINAQNINYYNNLVVQEKIKLGIIKQLKDVWNDCEEKTTFFNLIDKLKNNENVEILEFDLDLNLIKAIAPVYQVISYSEGLSSWNNLNGIIFGNNKIQYKNWKDLMIQTRTDDLSSELKKRFIFGAYSTDEQNFKKYYFKAKEIVNIFKNIFNDFFANIDAFILPGASSVAPLLEDVLNKKATTNEVDDLLEISNFTGMPSITIPYTEINNLAFGINLFANNKEDLKLLNTTLTLENIIKGIK